MNLRPAARLETVTTQRVPARKRIVELERQLADLEQFSELWDHLDKAILASLRDTKSRIPDEDLERFEQHRSQCSRLRPRVRALFRATQVRRVVFGQAEDIEIFGFVLERIPNLYAFREMLTGDGYRERFHELRPLSRSLIEQAMGEISAELEFAQAAGDEVDLLEERARTLGVTRFLRHLDTAEAQQEDGDYRDAISAARRAVERLVTELANKVARDAKRRKFNSAFQVLVDHQVVNMPTAIFLKAPASGLWGWLSELGVHDEDKPSDEQPEPTGDDARLAVDSVRVACGFLLARFSEHASKDASAGA